MDETTLESYTTPIDDEEADNPIDEFITFQQVLASKNTFFQIFQIFKYFNYFLLIDLTTQDPAYYALITSGLTTEQQKSLHELMVLADQKKAQIQSRLIEKQGGEFFELL